MGCRHGMSREEYQAWKQDRKDEWRARKAEWHARKEEWRARGGRYVPGYGWHPLNIAAMVIGFIIFFPIGLAILFWNIWSSRHVWAGGGPAFAGFAGFGSHAMWAGPSGNWQTQRDLSRDSGNSVFEDYKKATLERLEEERRRLVAEQEAFNEFLSDLRKAKDREEFERFMRDREARRADEAKDVGGNGQPN